MNDYIARVSENLAEKYAHEPEYLQCVNTMEPQAPLVGADGGIELDPVAVVGVGDAAVVHPGNQEGEHPLRLHHAGEEIQLLIPGVLRGGSDHGAYKKVTGRAESSALTGKGLTYGGSRIRQAAAGFGPGYFLGSGPERVTTLPPSSAALRHTPQLMLPKPETIRRLPSRVSP